MTWWQEAVDFGHPLTDRSAILTCTEATWALKPRQGKGPSPATTLGTSISTLDSCLLPAPDHPPDSPTPQRLCSGTPFSQYSPLPGAAGARLSGGPGSQLCPLSGGRHSLSGPQLVPLRSRLTVPSSKVNRATVCKVPRCWPYELITLGPGAPTHPINLSWVKPAYMRPTGAVRNCGHTPQPIPAVPVFLSSVPTQHGF